MSAFKGIELGPEGLKYIRDRLAEGKSLSSYLLETCDLEGGKVTTYLPEGTSDQEAKEFSIGGKLQIPKAPDKYLVTSNGSKWRIERKANTDAYIVGMIRDFLGEEQSCCLFEDAKSRPTDPRIRPQDKRIRVLGDEVYYMLDEDDALDEEKIARTVRDAHSGWHFVCVLTSLPQKKRLEEGGRNLTAEYTKALAGKGVKIVVGAYDGEGYLVWIKPPG